MSNAKKITIRDVATTAGVSVGTVSRVLNKKSVSKQTLFAVNSAISDLGYTPNSIAQSMRTRSSRAAALVVNDICNPLFAGIAKAMEAELRLNGYSLLIADTANDPEREVEIISSLVSKRVDAIAIAVSDEGNESTIRALRECEFPLIMLDRDTPDSHDAVVTEHADGMFQATKYLLDLGHTNIALVLGGGENRPGRERVKGYRRALEVEGVDFRSELIFKGPFSSEFGVESAEKILQFHNRPSAVIVGGNQIFGGLLSTLRRNDLDIPQDISIISCDDGELTQLLNPAITVLYRDINQIGKAAAELILQKVTSDALKTSSIRKIQTSLIVRESCRKLS